MHVHRSSAEAFRWMIEANCPMHYGTNFYDSRDGNNTSSYTYTFNGLSESSNRHVLFCASAMNSSGGSSPNTISATVNGLNADLLTVYAYSSSILGWFHLFLPTDTTLTIRISTDGRCTNWGIVGFTMFMKGTAFPVFDTANASISGTEHSTSGSLQLNAAARGGAFVALLTRDAEQGFTWQQPTGQPPFRELYRIDTRSNEWLSIYSGVNIRDMRSTFRVDIPYIRNGGLMAGVSWQDPCYTAVRTEMKFAVPGNTTWEVPDGVTSICAVAIGAGGGGSGTFQSNGRFGSGGGGGGLSYKNSISVTPGEVLTIRVGEGGVGGAPESNGGTGTPSEIKRGSTTLLRAAGGQGGRYNTTAIGGHASDGVGTVCHSGGFGSFAPPRHGDIGRAGGAAGYSGDGGDDTTTPTGGAGGASGPGGGGGGVNIYGQGSTGTNVSTRYTGGLGGSGGGDGGTTVGANGGGGGLYGGGGGGAGAGVGHGGSDSRLDGQGGGGSSGAIYIIWAAGKSFPNNVL